MPWVSGYFVTSLYLPRVDQGNKNSAKKIIIRRGRGGGRGQGVMRKYPNINKKNKRSSPTSHVPKAVTSRSSEAQLPQIHPL